MAPCHLQFLLVNVLHLEKRVHSIKRVLCASQFSQFYFIIVFYYHDIICCYIFDLILSHFIAYFTFYTIYLVSFYSHVLLGDNNILSNANSVDRVAFAQIR